MTAETNAAELYPPEWYAVLASRVINHPTHVQKHLNDYAALLRAGAVKVPEGWKLVPANPTKAMVDAGCPNGETVDHFDIATAYRAMLTATPPVPNAKASESEEGHALALKALQQCLSVLDRVYLDLVTMDAMPAAGLLDARRMARAALATPPAPDAGVVEPDRKG